MTSPKPTKTKVKKEKFIKIYASLRRKLDRTPTSQELVDAGVTKDTVRHHFGSNTNLDSLAREAHPDAFFDSDVGALWSYKANQGVKKKIKDYKRFVVTTAVSGGRVDLDFLNSIKNYCEVNDALLLVLMASDPASNAQTVDNTLLDEEIVLSDLSLNSNLFISTIKLSAKQIDPMTGLNHLGHRQGSFIFASPKQNLRFVPLTGRLAHAMMTTGAITQPNYETNLYMSKRLAYIAEHDHVMGALIVEIQDNNFFHYRQVQASDTGSFVDLGKEYSANSVQKAEVLAMVPGDWHSGETEPMVINAINEIHRDLGAFKHIVLHDAFNGMSINHHEEHNFLLRAHRANLGQLDLKAECKKLAEDFNSLLKLTEKLVIVKSNHDQFLDRYLAEGKYVQDPQNHKFSLELALAMLNDKDPLQTAIEGFPLSRAKDIKWLGEDTDFKLAGIHLGSHGHLGPNGAKGTIKSMAQTFDKSVSGHTHTPGIYRGAWVVGTSSFLKLEYTSGPSSWVNTLCLVYGNGSRQLINVLPNGKWRL